MDVLSQAFLGVGSFLTTAVFWMSGLVAIWVIASIPELVIPWLIKTPFGRDVFLPFKIIVRKFRKRVCNSSGDNPPSSSTASD